MSWTVSFLKLKRETQRIEDLEREGDTLPLGTKREILNLLKTWFPEANFHDPSWINCDFGTELSEIIISGVNELDDDDLIYSLGFRNPSYRLLRDVRAKTGWVALDHSAGDFINFSTLPPEYFLRYAVRDELFSGSRTFTEFVVYLRNQISSAWESGWKDELRSLASTLRTLEDFLVKTGDDELWPIVDNLAYFAQHVELADYALYVPEEAAIRGDKSRQD